jgi:hypothetical protein
MDLFNIRDWRYHYEVVITRQGRTQPVARVPSQWSAEITVKRMLRELEIGRNAIHWRRARGVHPRRLAGLLIAPLLFAILLPWFWPRVVLSLICIATICGLCSSGLHWMRGGEDDR